MKAVYWVEPGLLAGRPGPAAVPWDLDELWAGGFRTIVSLSRVNGAQVRAAGFRHRHVPLNGGLAVLAFLRRRLARQMLPLVDFVGAEVAAGRPTLVHCRQGQDRTGAVLAGYLIRFRRLSAADAMRRMREVNPRAMVSTGFEQLPALFAAISDVPPR